MKNSKSRPFSVANKRTKLKVGLVQYNIANNPEKNLKTIFTHLKTCLKQKPHFIVLPEMALGSPANKKEAKKWGQIYKKTLPSLQNWCATHKTGLVFFGMEEKNSRFYNACFWITPKGHIQNRYHKIHLFSFGGEHHIYSFGGQPAVTPSPWGPMGFAVCYDIRFPELLRALTFKGAKIIVVGAQWPSVRIHHWLGLLTSRAIENQVYIIGCNRTGRKKGLKFNGQSVVIGPWGRILLQMPAKQSTSVTMINLNTVDILRKKYPFLKEARLMGGSLSKKPFRP
ncbi:MAG TPA: hypothetical protein DDW49_06975 [Deltaproteobacteria bacterium]|nr:MAG: hypothetical protein A2048_07390 [Deltaproteobacteria bacterium GWA2_45_12]HBF13113.1 hypothetical protein [Deltaproteobacteria bacterium]